MTTIMVMSDVTLSLAEIKKRLGRKSLMVVSSNVTTAWY